MARQFVGVKFHSSDKRTYTYWWDGEPVACGDEVKVPDRTGDGWRRVTVHEISMIRPPFATKPILGRYDPVKDAPRDLFS